MEALENERQRDQMVAPPPAGPEPMRLARALVHDLRASLHGLSLALEMVRDELSPESNSRAARCLGLALAEAAALDGTIEQIGLWIRLAGEHYRPRLDRIDLSRAVGERPGAQFVLPSAPVVVHADRHLLGPALDGIQSFVKACAIPGENACIEVTAAGELLVSGPEHWLPVLHTVVTDPIPNLNASRGPAKWMVGMALAVAACRCCGGQVRLLGTKNRCELTLAWRLA